jgi:hypothetical protein
MLRKTMAMVAVLVCSFPLTALADGLDEWENPPRTGPLLPDPLLKEVQEFQGILDYNDGLGPQIPEWDPWIGYGITVQGKWQGLVLPKCKDVQELARKLIGKQAIVRGRIEQRTLNGLIRHQIDVIVVSSLRAVPDKKVGTAVKPIKEWGKILNDETLKNAAPAKGYVTDAKTLAKLWEAWKVNNKMPKVDFAKVLVLVATSGGPNALSVDVHLDDEGNLTTMCRQTLKDGPGFGYKIIVIKRDGIKTIGGRTLQ